MWSEITADEFEQIPGKAAPKPNQWDELLDAVDLGKAIRIPVSEDNKLRGMRIGIGRRAKFRHIPIETRAAQDSLYIRRAVDADEAPPEADATPSAGEDVTPAEQDQVFPEVSTPTRRGRRKAINA